MKTITKSSNVQPVLKFFMTAVLAACFMFHAVLAVHAEGNDTEEKTLTYTDSQGIVYELDHDHTCYVSGYAEKTESTVTIPSQIGDAGGVYTVKGIQKTAFAQCSTLKKLEIPNDITDISAGAFSECKNLKEIAVLPVKTSEKKNGNVTTVSVKVSGALLSGAADVKVEFDKDAVAKAVSEKGTDITLMVSVTDSGGAKNTMVESVTLKSGAAKAIAQSGKNLKLRSADTAGKNYYVKISAGSLKQITEDLELKLQEKDTGSITGTFQTNLKKALQKNSLNEDGVKIINVSFGNGSKTDMDVIIPAEDIKGIKAGSEVYAYRYDKNKRAFAAVSFHPFTVSKQGTVQLSLSNGGSYLITAKQLQYMAVRVAGGFLKESGKTYYIDGNGNAVRGWKKIGSDYYYFDRNNGKMATGGKTDNVKITSTGAAEKAEASVKKIQTMIKARAVMEEVTNESDSKSQKIEKCFRWIFQFPYKRYRRLQPIYTQPGWEVTFANDIFDHHQGCCVSEASALAFIFHECGYETVYVACDTSHAWVELNGRVYDPLFAEARGFSQYYNRSYEGYGMRAVLKRLI